MPLVLIILSSGIAPFSFASVESEAQEDIQAGCRDGQTLVFRTTYHDYVCVEPSTADRWEELGLAEIVKDYNVESSADEKIEPAEELTPAIVPSIPERTPSVISDNSECREGYALVYRFIHKDTFCTSPSTASTWERLGLASIESLPVPNTNDSVPNTNDSVPNAELEEEIIRESIAKEKPLFNDPVGIVLPLYPDQPSIHPSLEDSSTSLSPEIFKINHRIWVAVGFDTGNSIMIEGEKGIIIVDTLSNYESAKKVLKEFRKITDKPVKTIIYTHGNLDHVQGTKAFLEEGDSDVEIVSHKSLLDFYINENSILGPVAFERSAFASGLFLPDDGPDSANLGVFKKSQSGLITFVPPTDTFSDVFTLDISGVNMKLVHIENDSSDQIFVWLPDDEALLTGDNLYEVFPNISNLRGIESRDPMNYVNAIDEMISLDAKHLVPSHLLPIIDDKSKVYGILQSARDATQFVHDQTIRGINSGYSIDELTEMITLPEHVKDNPFLSELNGQPAWYVKQIYYDNVGWFKGDPTFLVPLSEIQRSEKIVRAFGGEDDAISQVRLAIDNDEYNWAAELATSVLNTNPDNVEAKLLKAYALRVIGQQMLSNEGRHWAITSALELEGKITIDPDSVSQINYEYLSEFPIDKILKTLPTKLNSNLIKDDYNGSLNILYTDTDEKFSLTFRNNIMVVSEGLTDDPWDVISLDTETHKMILTKQLSMIDAYNSGDLIFNGNIDDLQWYYDVFDRY